LEVAAVTVDDLMLVEYPADAFDNEPAEGWMLRGPTCWARRATPRSARPG